MLRVSPGDGGSFFNADKRKKQVTLVDPASGQSSSAEDRRPTVAAPKMFAFDAIFTEEDSQVRLYIHIHTKLHVRVYLNRRYCNDILIALYQKAATVNGKIIFEDIFSLAI